MKALDPFLLSALILTILIGVGNVIAIYKTTLTNKDK